MTGFDPAQFERSADEDMASVMPESWGGHERLEEDAYPYGEWTGLEGGFHFNQV